MNIVAKCITSLVQQQIALAYKISSLVVCVNSVAWSQIPGLNCCFSLAFVQQS